MDRRTNNRLLIILLLACFAFPNVSDASDNPVISVTIEGKYASFEPPPLMLGETILVPFRPVFEAFGLSIQWDEASKTITGLGGLQTIQVQIDNSQAVVNGTTMRMPMAPRIIGSVTYVPLRFISEATGREVVWNADAPSVSIGPAGDPFTYEGELKDGHREGNGKLYMNGKLMYEGEFHNGVIEGRGKKYYSNSKMMYEGEFAEGNMHGRGKLYKENGTLWYDAEFNDNSINGPGICYFPEGHRLVGEFKDGVPHGPGKYYYGDGTLRFVGVWKDGTRNGFGTWYYANGNKFFEGQLVASYPIDGKLYYDNGILKYDGELDNLFAPNGQGTLYKEDGTIDFHGSFSHGRPSEKEPSNTNE